MKLPEIKTLPTQEDIDRLERENAELKAKIELLHLWVGRLSFELIHDDNYQTTHAFCELQDSIAATPAQCLAERDREVAARAVEGAVRKTHTHRIHGEVRLYHCQSALLQYANKIKSGEVEI